MPPSNMFGPGSTTILADLRAVKRQWSHRLLIPAAALAATARRATATPVSPAPQRNVVGIGVGERVTAGQPTGEPALKFFVRIKYPEGQLDAASKLPKFVDGLPVDVEESGTFKAEMPAKRRAAPKVPNPRKRFRPARPGCSIGFEVVGGTGTMAGTFGALVKKGGQVFILSNNHVLADEGRLAKGAPIYQPGLLDRGRAPKDKIGELTGFAALAGGRIDAAIAKVSKRSLVSPQVLHIGKLKGRAAAAIDMVVHKFGRTTDYTVGRITSIDTDVSVEYDTSDFFFSEQIIIVSVGRKSFSDAGDSGSLIVERPSNKAVGLLFAGSASHTIANHLDGVLHHFGVSMML